MASITTNTTAGHSASLGILTAIGSFFAAIGHALVKSAESSSRMKKLQALQAKSDEELAALGLTRDEIPHHVFSDLYYI